MAMTPSFGEDTKTMASDNPSASTLVADSNDTRNQSSEKGGIFQRISGHFKSNGSSKDSKKQSISESGPYIFAFDPKAGKEVLQKNPHWPNEDSWKRVEESQGQWAMGGEAGQQNKDFGGTVG